jgi:hypothetical protein
MDMARRLADRVGAQRAFERDDDLTPDQTLNLLPIKWMYADDNLSAEVLGATTEDGGAPQDEQPSGFFNRAAAALGSAAKAGAHRNPLRHKNVYELPGAEEKRIYLVFTHLTGRHKFGIYVNKTQAINIVNWFINILNGGESGPIQELPLQGGGGKRRKRKSHRRKSHRRKTHKRKRTRRRR